MIKIEHIITPSPKQMEFVVEGMRNPFNSWNKSDSYKTHIEDAETLETANFEFFIGDNDMDLMNRLRNAGTDHRKFMRQMPLMMRITAPLYWWKEFDTYKVGTVSNSCSTMHKIAAKEFTWDDFSCEHLFGEKGGYDVDEPFGIMGLLIDQLNEWRNCFLQDKDTDEWWQLIQLLPSNYNQTRNVTMNYENALNMYQARKNHKLDEWKEFCKVLETIPYSWLLLGKDGDGNGKNNQCDM